MFLLAVMAFPLDSRVFELCLWRVMSLLSRNLKVALVAVGPCALGVLPQHPVAVFVAVHMIVAAVVAVNVSVIAS